MWCTGLSLLPSRGFNQTAIFGWQTIIEGFARRASASRLEALPSPFNCLFCCLFSRFMPIYAYRCASCGHAKDVLQKMSDPLLTVCPACQAATFEKQLTAAGFQLKGSGWYVTDFRDGKKDGANSGVGEAKTSVPAVASPTTDSAAPAPAASTAAASPAPAAATPAPAPAPAAKAPAGAP
jgi:putative FmdB family regulatory protein